MINSKIMFVLFSFMPFCFLSAQERDTTVAMLDNKPENKLFLTYTFLEKKKPHKILILYKDSIYRLSEFNLLDSVQRLGLTINMINNKDSIQKILARDVESIILLEDREKNPKSHK